VSAGPRIRPTWPRVKAAAFAAAALVAASGAGPALAHGFGQRYDLPVPLWMWVAGAAAAVICSFVVVSVFITKTAGGGEYPRVNLLRYAAVRALVRPAVLAVVKAGFVGFLLLIFTAGLAGNQNPTRNLVPTAVWVLWWVGFAYISALVGNLWMLVNPWNTLFSWGERLLRRWRWRLPLLGPSYPPALGYWPAALLFFGFAWTELVFIGRAVPAQLTLIILAYTVLTALGMLAVGRAVWLRYGDPFTAVFGVLSLFAPTEVRVTDRRICRLCPLRCVERDSGCVDCYECFANAPASSRELNLRPLAAGLTQLGPCSVSRAVLVVLVLSTVTFDGFTGTPAWSNFESLLYGALPDLGGQRLAVIGTAGLIIFPVGFWALYRLFSGWVARIGGAALRAWPTRLSYRSCRSRSRTTWPTTSRIS